MFSQYLDLNLSIIDLVYDIMGWLSLHSAADRLAGSQDFLDGSLKLPGHRTGAHRLSDFSHLLQGQIAAVRDWEMAKEYTIEPS